MQLIVNPAPPVEGNPYDTCCVGSHEGVTGILQIDKDITLKIVEMRSGLGPSYNFTIDAGKWGYIERAFSIFVDDDGKLIFKVNRN